MRQGCRGGRSLSTEGLDAFDLNITVKSSHSDCSDKKDM